MLLSEDLNNRGNTYRITACEAGKITINETSYYRSLFLSQNFLNPDWPPQSLAALTVEHLKPIIELKPAVVLLGTGNHLTPLSDDLLAVFHQNRIGIECMTNRAACMTFSALAAEDRCVVTALMIRQENAA